MKRIFKSKISLLLFFAAIAIIAFWQIAFMYNTLKWDMLDCHLPWRSFVADCISHRIFPFWCPYQNFGYPIHADMRSVLSPEFWIAGIFLKGYSEYTLHFFFIFYIVISGYGMQRLTSFLGCNLSASFAAGLTYMLSGFIVSQSQEISSLAGLAWMPFAILFYLRMTFTGKYIDALKTSIFLFLMISGAYPALTIILNYLFLTIFITWIIKLFLAKDFVKLKTILFNNILLYGIILLLCSFYIFSLLNSVNYVSRFNGLENERLMVYPFTPQSLISMIFPFSSVKSLNFFKTDVTMNNLYIGIFFLVFFLISFFRKRTLLENILLIFGLLALLISFGPYTPFRHWSKFLPLMDMFKYPSFFRPFVMIPIIILSAISFTNFMNNIEKLKKNLIVITLGIASIIIIAMISVIGYAKSIIVPFLPLNAPFAETLNNSNIYGHIILEGSIHLILIGLFILTLRFSDKIKRLQLVLLFIIGSDMIISVQLNSFYTIVATSDARDLNNYLKKQPQGFPIPEMKAIGENTDRSVNYSPLWENTNTFSRQLSFEGFNTFTINSFDCITDSSNINLLESVKRNKPLYFADKIFPIDSLKNLTEKEPKNTLFFSDSDYSVLSHFKFCTSASDTIIPISFSPNAIKAIVFNKNNVLLTYLQTYYPGWHFYLDGKERLFYKSNINFISAIVPGGKHIIEFRYLNKPVLAGFIITYSVFIFILLILLYINLNKFIKKKPVLFIIILVLTIVPGYFYFSLTGNSLNEVSTASYFTLKEQIKSYENKFGAVNIAVAINCDRPDICDSFKSEVKSKVSYFRISNYKGLKVLSEYVDTTKENYLIYCINQMVKFDGINEIIKEKFPTIISEKKLPNGKIYIFSRESRGEDKPLYRVDQDFLSDKQFWNISGYQRFDTIIKFDGRKVLVLDSIYPYSTAFTCNSAQLKTTNNIKRLVFNVDFLTSSVNNTAFLCVKYKKPFCVRRDWYFPLRDFVKEANHWNHAVFELDMNLGHSTRKSLEIFIWDQDGKRMLIGNVKIAFY